MNAVWWLPRERGRGPRRSIARWAALAALILCTGTVARGAIEEQAGLQTTPPRLAFLDGEVMFWRPGAGDWEAAQLNIPLAAGDSLATRSGKLEMQIGARSFVRAGDGTQLRVQSNEPDFLQLDVSAGHVSIDLREVRRGSAVRIDTPNAAVAIVRDGYYRVDVDAETTRVIVRRGGQASVTPSGGSIADVATGEAIEVTGTESAQLAALAAPPFDDWDRWNYDRVDRLLAAPRSYAVSADVYGAGELEQYGSWRYANTYGRVWVPNSVPAGWAPYSDGRWIWDPLYGYSWVDYAPWGWAPYHYGRWVYAGYWGWAPGPVLAAPFYSPALVAFFGGPGFSVGFGVGVPFVSWVPLGWGEPLIPWWGGVGFIGAPCWRGWGGPRIVNNVIINNNNVVNVNKINFYRNMNAPGGVVGVPRDQFNSRSLDRVRLTNFNRDQLQPVHGALPVASKGGGIPDVGGRRPFGGGAAGAAGTNFGRGGQGSASSGANFDRAGQQALGTQRSGAAAAGTNAGRMSGAFDGLRTRGPGALTAPVRQDSGTAGAPAARSTNFGRGQSPPPLLRPIVGAIGRWHELRSERGATVASQSRRPVEQLRPTVGAFGRRQQSAPCRCATAAEQFCQAGLAHGAGSRTERAGGAPVRAPGSSSTGSIRGARVSQRPRRNCAPARARRRPAGHAEHAGPRREVRPGHIFHELRHGELDGRICVTVENRVGEALRGFNSGARGFGGAPSGGMQRGGGGAMPNIGRAFGGLSAGGHGGGRAGR